MGVADLKEADVRWALIRSSRTWTAMDRGLIRRRRQRRYQIPDSLFLQHVSSACFFTPPEPFS